MSVYIDCCCDEMKEEGVDKADQNLVLPAALRKGSPPRVGAGGGNLIYATLGDRRAVRALLWQGSRQPGDKMGSDHNHGLSDKEI